MSSEERKAAITAYKQRKVVSGIYAIRCTPIGTCSVGQATNLATVWTRVTFELRHGRGRNRALQQAWNTHGEDCWTFEEIERLDEDTPPYLLHRILSDRLAHWRAQMSAERVE